jgi:uncharacterized protein (TIGR02996 family)
MNDRQAFLAAIQAEPLDHLLRCVFADWLDEHGEVEEANRQRQWVAAYEYLANNFVSYYGYEEGAEGPAHVLALQEIEYFVRSLVEEGGICFGSESLVENMWDETMRAEFYRSLEIVTGTTILPEVRERAGFRCAC